MRASASTVITRVPYTRWFRRTLNAFGCRPWPENLKTVYVRPEVDVVGSRQVCEGRRGTRRRHTFLLKWQCTPPSSATSLPTSDRDTSIVYEVYVVQSFLRDRTVLSHAPMSSAAVGPNEYLTVRQPRAGPPTPCLDIGRRMLAEPGRCRRRRQCHAVRPRTSRR